MIFEVQSYALIFHDAIFAMGVGFIAGAFYQILGAFLYKGKVKLFIRDIATGLVFTALVFSYSVSFANYRILRWYMVLPALIGMVSFPFCFSKWGNIAVRFMSVTAVYCGRNVRRKVCGKLLAISQKNKEKKQKFTQKNPPELLKTTDILMYN